MWVPGPTFWRLGQPSYVSSKLGSYLYNSSTVEAVPREGDLVDEDDGVATDSDSALLLSSEVASTSSSSSSPFRDVSEIWTENEGTSGNGTTSTSLETSNFSPSSSSSSEP